MTIRDLGVYMSKLWDWGFLDGCFGNGRIRPTDVDGLVESNGHFLLLEAKSPEIDIPRGQKIMFDRLTRVPRFTVLVFWGDAQSQQPQEYMIWGQERKMASREILRSVVSEWYKNTIG